MIGYLSALTQECAATADAVAALDDKISLMGAIAMAITLIAIALSTRK